MIQPRSYDIEVVVLAGGNSTRMGRPKWQLPFTKGETFLAHILRVYNAFGVRAASVILPSSVQAVQMKKQDFELSMIVKFLYHDNPNADRTASIVRGLSSVRPYSKVFIQDVDRPLMSAQLLRTLDEYLPPHGYAAPEINGHAGHPVLLSATCAQSVLKDLKYGVWNTLRDALQSHERVRVPSGYQCDLNFNTAAEYEQYFWDSEAVS